MSGPKIRNNSRKAKRNLAMTDILDDVRGHDRATGLTERLKTALMAWQDDFEAANARIAQLRASRPPPSPNLGVVMGPDFAQLSANLGRNLMEGWFGILSAVFEAAPINS